jgi:hypothetical protein
MVTTTIMKNLQRRFLRIDFVRLGQRIMGVTDCSMEQQEDLTIPSDENGLQVKAQVQKRASASSKPPGLL